MHEIKLHPYKADVGGFQSLKLGTKDSYGIEQLHIVPGAAWNGLVVTATFVTGSTRVRVVVPQDGIINVPQEATAATSGNIVFSGVSDGVQRITVDLPYTVSEHSPIDGADPAPTPDQWAQLVTEYQNRLDKAVPPNGTPGYVLGATENGNAWVPQTGGGGGSGGIITDDDTGTVYDAAVHIQDGYPVLILTERSADNG